MSQSVRPFDVMKVLKELFSESEHQLYNLARGYYYFDVEKRDDSSYVYVNAEPLTLVAAAHRLNQALFHFYFITERRFIQLLRMGMKLMQHFKTSSEGRDILQASGYGNGDLWTMNEDLFVSDFISDFDNVYKFRKMSQSLGDNAFGDLLSFLDDLYEEVSDTYDKDKAALFRSSKILGQVLRTLATVARLLPPEDAASCHHIFPMWRLCSATGLPWNQLGREFRVDLAGNDAADLYPDFWKYVSQYDMNFRVMCLFSGLKKGTFTTFINDNYNLHGTELIRSDRFTGDKLLALARNFLRTHPMRYPAHKLLDEANAKEFRNSVDDTRCHGANVRILYNEVKAIVDSYKDMEDDSSDEDWRFAPPGGRKARYEDTPEGYVFGGYPASENFDAADGYEDPYAPTPGEKPSEKEVAEEKKKTEEGYGVVLGAAAVVAAAAIYYS